MVEIHAIRETLSVPEFCAGAQNGTVFIVIDDARWDECDGILALFRLALSGPSSSQTDLPNP